MVPIKTLVTILAAVAVAVTAAPLATAQPHESTVYLHDLFDEDGSYTGCHVGTAQFTTYRLTVQEGTEVALTVTAPANNTETHLLSIEGHDAESAPVQPGDTTTVTFTAGSPGSYAIMCDGERGSLQGLLAVQSGDSTDNGADTPAPGALALLAAGAVAAGLAHRRRV